MTEVLALQARLWWLRVRLRRNARERGEEGCCAPLHFSQHSGTTGSGMGQTHAGPVGRGSGQTWRSSSRSSARGGPQQGIAYAWGAADSSVSASHFTDGHEPPTVRTNVSLSSRASPPLCGPSRWVFGDLLQWKGEVGLCGGRQ